MKVGAEGEEIYHLVDGAIGRDTGILI